MTSPFEDSDESSHPHLYPGQGFSNAQFVAHVLPSSLKVLANGEIEFKVRVKKEFGEEAWKLRDAYRIPLQFDVKTWENYQIARDRVHGLPIE